MAKILIRRGTAATATSNNPVLDDGEPGWEKDTRTFKIGDGETPWTELPGVTGSGGSGGDVPVGTMVMLRKTGVSWPTRPAGGTAIRVHWVGGAVDDPPPTGLSNHDLWSVPMETGPQ